MKNKEISFEVDISKMPCGTSGTVYFVEMEADGGLHYPGNNAGAAYGTGYCDAQCPKDIKFIYGEANSLNRNFQNGGQYGSCCFEMDLWEANSISTAIASHHCQYPGSYRCPSNECSGLCDGGGCDLNPYRNKNYEFYGSGKQVDTSRPFTVVTQFITRDGDDASDLVKIKRFYIQNGVVIDSPSLKWDTPYAGADDLASVTDDYCATKSSLYGDSVAHSTFGGMKTLGDAMGRGTVLAVSVWTDPVTRMLWVSCTFFLFLCCSRCVRSWMACFLLLPIPVLLGRSEGLAQLMMEVHVCRIITDLCTYDCIGGMWLDLTLD